MSQEDNRIWFGELFLVQKALSSGMLKWHHGCRRRQHFPLHRRYIQQLTMNTFRGVWQEDGCGYKTTIGWVKWNNNFYSEIANFDKDLQAHRCTVLGSCTFNTVAECLALRCPRLLWLVIQKAWRIFNLNRNDNGLSQTSDTYRRPAAINVRLCVDLNQGVRV